MVTRKLRIFLEPEFASGAFEFEIVFKLYRNRTFTVRTGGGTAVTSGGASA